MTADIDLLSLVLTLRPAPREAPDSPPGPDLPGKAAGWGPPKWHGRAAHALLLDAARFADAELAERLHAGSDARPFTASGLIGFSARRGLSPDRTYSLRLTALTAPLGAALLRATESGPLAKGAAVNLAGDAFSIEAVDVGQARNSHPWAAALSYEALSAPWLLGRQRPEPRLTLQFASPTTFKSGGKHVPVPLPGLVFGSLLERWNAFAPVALPDEVRRFADECLALSAYRLSTRMIPLKEGSLRAGALGEARYTALNADRYWLSLLHLLADFALFSGVGAGTGMGLGQSKKIKGEDMTGQGR